jgi:hypothetical protein
MRKTVHEWLETHEQGMGMGEEKNWSQEIRRGFAAADRLGAAKSKEQTSQQEDEAQAQAAVGAGRTRVPSKLGAR